MNAFREEARTAFVDEMMAHLKRFSPEICRTLSGDQLRTAVRGGIVRAEGYGFTYRGPIRLFLECMFILGSSFDGDPQYPWASETLQRQDFPNQMFKAGRLEHLVRDYTVKVNGLDNELSRQALLRLERYAERLDLAFHASSLKSDIVNVFAWIFPSKLSFIGQPAVERLIEQAEELSRSVFGANYPRATTVVAVLGFSFGVGFAKDPILPWIRATLQDDRIVDAGKRAVRLERRALIWLKAVNKNLSAMNRSEAREVET